jgi:hypothetical protein
MGLTNVRDLQNMVAVLWPLNQAIFKLVQCCQCKGKHLQKETFFISWNALTFPQPDIENSLLILCLHYQALKGRDPRDKLLHINYHEYNTQQAIAEIPYKEACSPETKTRRAYLRVQRLSQCIQNTSQRMTQSNGRH